MFELPTAVQLGEAATFLGDVATAFPMITVAVSIVALYTVGPKIYQLWKRFFR